MTLGQRLKRARKAKGWSLDKLGREVGVSRQAVFQWEQPDGTKPDRKSIEKLCTVLALPVDFFYDGTHEAHEPLEAKLRRLLPHERKLIEAAIDGILADRMDPKKAM